MPRLATRRHPVYIPGMNLFGIRSRTQAVVFVVLIAAFGFFVLDPLRLFSKAPAPYDQGSLGRASAAYQKAARPAAAEVLRLFDDRRLVLLGRSELEMFGGEMNFAASLLAALPARGVGAFGVDFLAAADQADIDRLMAGADFDEALAKDLMLRCQPERSFREFLDLLRAAWAANARRPAGTPALRLLGLAPTVDFSSLKTQADLEDPARRGKAYPQGLPDAFMARLVEDYFKAGPAAGSPKMLAWVHRYSSLLRFEDEAYTRDMALAGFPGQRRLGRLVAEKLGASAVASVIFYTATVDDKSASKLNYLDGGRIEQVLRAQAPGATAAYPTAVDLRDSPFGDLDAGKTNFGIQRSSRREPAPRLRDLGDLLVVLGPVYALAPPRPIDGFVDEGNLARAVARWPEEARKAAKPEQFRRGAEDLVRQYQKYLDNFR